MKTKKKHQPILALRLPPELLAQLDEYAKRTATTRSTVVRIALAQGLRGLEKMVAALEPPA